jgi:prevent-host-death family protein
VFSAFNGVDRKLCVHYGSVNHYVSAGFAMKTISAANANRQFSTVLREVAQGEAFVITSRGRAVATLAPVEQRNPLAHEALLSRLRAQPLTGKCEWTRDELYEDGE